MERLLLLLLLASLAHAGCFRPNGTSRNDPSGPDAYLPCSSSTTHSMCCRTGSELGNDVCRDDGLCSNGDIIWRESCTDSTWKADACIKLCISDSLTFDGEPYSGTDVKIKVCDNGSLCCGDSETARPCCQQGKGVWLVEGKVYSSNPSSVSSSTSSTSSTLSVTASYTTTATPIVPPTSNPTATPSNQPSNHASASRDYTGVIAGSAVGGIVVLAVLICFLWWLTFMKKKGRSQPTAPAELDSSMAYQIDDGAYKFAQEQQYHEAPLNTREHRRADVPLFEVK